MPVRATVVWRRQEAPESGQGAWAVVIDVLRATSSIVTALAAGAACVRPVDEVASALAAREEHPGSLLAGERSCRIIPGFDLGNSPASFFLPSMTGREVILATTNGSRALAAAAAASFDRVLAVSLLNIGSAASAVEAADPESLVIICAGTNGSFSLDDALVAGALLERLSAVVGDDAAMAARMLYRANRDDVLGLLLRCQAGKNLVEAGMRGDVEFCARADAFDVVPHLTRGVLVR